MHVDGVVFDALGDRTRRRVFEHVAAGPVSVGEIAAALPVSRPAVSKHLRVLREAGLVADTADGTRRLYRVDADGLRKVRGWVDAMWDTALERFARAAEAAENERGRQ